MTETAPATTETSEALTPSTPVVGGIVWWLRRRSAAKNAGGGTPPPDVWTP